jgi:hypothetical protein
MIDNQTAKPARTMNTTRLATACKASLTRHPTATPSVRVHPDALAFTFTERKFRVAAILRVSGKRISPLGASGSQMTVPSAGTARRTGVSVDRSRGVGARSGASGGWI